MSAQWWDDFLVSDEGALHRMLVGRTITVKTVEQVGPPEGADTVEYETQAVIRRVKRAMIGVDSRGFFCGLVCEVDIPTSRYLRIWTFFDDGKITDDEDRNIGTFVPSDLNLIAQMTP